MRIKEHGLKDVQRLMGIHAGVAFALVVGCVTVVATLVSSPRAQAADLHGISFLKGCNSPTIVGEAYICTFQVRNNVDTANDTLTITSLVDIVHSGSGDVSSGNVLPTATLTLAGGAFCNVGQTLCTLPFNSSVTLTISFYLVAPGDPNPLTDTGTLTWQDTCSSGSPNCPIGSLLTQAGSQSEVQTPTPTPTPTNTPTNTPTPTPTPTNTPTPTKTFTPTATRTPGPVGVGGMVRLPPAFLAESGATAEDSRWAAWTYAVLAGGVAGVVVAVTAGGWYTRRRWMR